MFGVFSVDCSGSEYESYEYTSGLYLSFEKDGDRFVSAPNSDYAVVCTKADVEQLDCTIGDGSTMQIRFRKSSN